MKFRFSTLRLVVRDLEAAKSWIEAFVEQAPIENSPDFTAFRFGNSGLEILSADEKNPVSFGGSIGYWSVDDLNEAIAKAQSMGGTIYRGPLSVAEINKTICQISTPFGAVIGLEAENNPTKKERTFPQIVTQNLILRLPEISDIPDVLRYLLENENHLSPFDPKKPEGFYTEKFWQERIPHHHEAFRSDQAVRLYLFNLSNPSEVVGTLEFSQIARGPFQACYLGYGIAKKFEGKGLMYEGVSAAIQYAFHDLNIHRIMANHLPENERSARLLLRLGFSKECVAKNYLRINGIWRDHVLNSLTNHEWKEK